MLAPVPGEFVLTRDQLVFERRKFPFPHFWIFEPQRRVFLLADVVAVRAGSLFDKVGYFWWASPLSLQMKGGRRILIRVDNADSWEADVLRLTQSTN